MGRGIGGAKWNSGRIVRTVIVSMVIAALSLTGILWQAGLFRKAESIGAGTGDALYNLFQIARKDGFWNALNAVRRKFQNDPRLGLGYRLSQVGAIPTAEDPHARASLPEFRVIPAAPIGQLSPSRPDIAEYRSWHRSHADEHSTKFSRLDQITPSNVSQLHLAWSFATRASLGDATKPGFTAEANPIVAGGRLFLPSIDGDLIALEAASGREIWRTRLPQPVARRGLVWEPHEDFSKSRLFVPTGHGVYAISAQDGRILGEFGNHGQVGDQLSLIAPVIVNGALIVAIIKPAVEAYDLHTGKLLWSRPLLEMAEPENTLLTGGVPWGGMSADVARRMIYVSTGNARPELWGTTRPGDNRNTCSVVAIEASSGRIVWAFQEVAHDLWDLDIPSPPVLTTIQRDGRRIDVVATVTKLGNTLLLDRDFGKPIFDYRLRRAPVSALPGERTAPYQPDLQLPQPFAKQVFAMDDVTELSPAARSSVMRQIRGARAGFFEPPLLGGKIVAYGLGGGALWPGAAVDPRNGRMYVPSNQVPWIIRAEYHDMKADPRTSAALPGDALYQSKCARCHGPDRNGSGSATTVGENGYPSLAGVTFIKSSGELLSKDGFEKAHEPYRTLATVGDLKELFGYFQRLDAIADKAGALASRAWWQPLMDHQGRPGSRPPWGFLTAIDLNSGRHVWRIPFGNYEDLRVDGRLVRGQFNLGGVIATGSGLVFATGTLDDRIRAFDAANGRELWSFKLPAAGSAPPTTFAVDGVQYVVVVAGGGGTSGFSGRSDRVLAFRLLGGPR